MRGHSRDVAIAPDGSVLEVEEQVALDSLPAAVQEGLHKNTGAGTITRVESITKHGTLVGYEAQVRTGGKRSEVQGSGRQDHRGGPGEARGVPLPARVRPARSGNRRMVLRDQPLMALPRPV